MQLLLVASSVLSLMAFVQAFDHFPHPCQQTHLVTASDTCKSISKDFKTNEGDIQKWNQDFIPGFDCKNLAQGKPVCVKYSVNPMGKRSNDSQKKHHDRPSKKGSDPKKSVGKKGKSHKSKNPKHHITSKKHATEKRSYRKKNSKKGKKHHSKKGPKGSSALHHTSKKSANKKN